MRAGRNFPKRSVNCGRWRQMWVVLAVVLFACIAPCIAITVAAEDVLNHPAESGQKSCADGVKAYLLQTSTKRAEVEAWVRRARAELNEARSILEEEKSGERRPSGNTQRRLKAAWAKFESASEVARKFDETVLNSHGNLPHECIREVNALSATDPDAGNWAGQAMYLLEKTVLNLRLYGETLRGVVLFNVGEYNSAAEFYKEAAHFFNVKSQKVYEEIQRRKKDRKFEEESAGLWELAEFALLYTRAMTFALVPWAIILSACILLVLFAPFILAAVLIPQFVWRVWVQLFFLHYTYGLTVDGFFLSLRQYVDLVVQRDWAGLQERCVTAFFILVSRDDQPGTFFNGIFAAALVLITVVLMLILIYYWVRLPYAIIASELELWRSRHVLRQLQKDMAGSANIKSNSSDSREASSANAGGKKKVDAHPTAAAPRSTKETNKPNRDGGSSSSNGGSGGNSSNLERRRRKKKA
ncbi:hypothetical protein TraAM80_05413 [Trypanosoma rangeli]|uniref:Uncharacterized protein n=1 Tax=Trypanosoma rangeli TaxID=5698 RepID=A0A422NEU3_TRYRA|nr:uncharacterized protein TraAM80_05413 [Trypanosoma rangeli]RNF03959.1 hypothetical protein TraAM80_05413 [Trypanosoma rangeli]|eukprot:RNF03959.1 hypothetical protein TraAM80_05413 [Trypanosoma rangeli]